MSYHNYNSWTRDNAAKANLLHALSCLGIISRSNREASMFILFFKE